MSVALEMCTKFYCLLNRKRCATLKYMIAKHYNVLRAFELLND